MNQAHLDHQVHLELMLIGDHPVRQVPRVRKVVAVHRACLVHKGQEAVTVKRAMLEFQDHLDRQVRQVNRARRESPVIPVLMVNQDHQE